MGNHSGISRGRRDNLDKLLASEQLMRKLDDDTYRICRLFIMSYRQPIYRRTHPFNPPRSLLTYGLKFALKACNFLTIKAREIII